MVGVERLRVIACLAAGFVVVLGGVAEAAKEASSTNGVSKAARLSDTNHYASLEYDAGAPFLERAHNWAFVRMQKPINYVDATFANGLASSDYVSHSTFRLGVYLEGRYLDELELRFDPKFSADLNLPNAERRLKVVVESSELGTLPGATPAESDVDWRVGLRRVWRRFEGSLGVKARWPPVAYAQMRWRPSWSWGRWHYRPEQRVFYESDDGFGALSSLQFHRWFGQRHYVGSSSSARYTERDTRVAWEQSLFAAHVRGLLEDGEETRAFRDSHASSCMGLRYSVFGSYEDVHRVDLHRVTLVNRFPLYQDWLYLQVDPELEWRNDEDWRTAYVLRVGLDILFWGIHEVADE